MNVLTRARNILASPKTEWSVIDAESSTIGSLYTGYFMLLAAIPAVASFIGLSLIGVGVFGTSIRMPIANGLASMLVGYVLTLVACAVLALVIDTLAPTFGGSKNRIRAFKVAVYGSTAAMVSSIFTALPMLSVLGLLASLYSIYLIYLGLPVLMKCPQEKALAYTAVTLIVAIILGVVLGSVGNLFRTQAGPDFTGGEPFSIYTPDGSLTVDPNGSGTVTLQSEEGKVSVDIAQLEAVGKRMEELSEKLEAAYQSGNMAEAQELALEIQALQQQYAPSE